MGCRNQLRVKTVIRGNTVPGNLQCAVGLTLVKVEELVRLNWWGAYLTLA